MAKAKLTPNSWNEFNTFSKLIFPYLQDSLKYPERSSKFFDEQTWVRKRGEKNGPYDGAFKNETGVILLIEAKKEAHKLLKKDEDQLFDYCLGGFPVPPPYALLSNGLDFKWYKRLKNREGEFSYAPCDSIPWKKAIEEKGAGLLTEQLTLKQTIQLLKSVREKIFHDLTDQFFPNGYKFSSAKLGTHKKGFDKILYTRKSFVDPTLENANDAEVIKSVLSSIALSIILKILFIKIITDRKNDPFPEKFKKEIVKQAKNFPGILKAEPYDTLEISDACEKFISEIMASASITQALVFEGRSNPIGDIWDGLVESEELDLQVKSLGNVYTPPFIVNFMTDMAQTTLKSWKDISVLEPSCGSGHFVREIYSRIRDAYLGKSGDEEKVILAHKKAMKNLRALDIDPFAVQTTQLGMFLELYRVPAIWNAIAPQGNFDFGAVVHVGDFLDSGFFSTIENFSPDLIIGNPPYGIKVSDSFSTNLKLSSKDSYGYFIQKSIDRINDGGKIIFILSNSFMTISSHLALRKEILQKTKIQSIIQLHRNTFPRDVFPCILMLEKINESTEITNHTYDYYDAWPIHPKNQKDILDNCFKFILGTSKTQTDEALFKKYIIPQEIISFNHNLPIFGASPTLFLYCVEKTYKNFVKEASITFGKKKSIIKGRILQRSPSSIIELAELNEVAESKVGLQTGDNKKYVRKSELISGGPVKGGYDNIDRKLIVDENFLNTLSEEQRVDLIANGIDVLNYEKDQYYVPYNKGSEQKTDLGQLNNFWNETEYWINWSQKAVHEMKDSDRARFQNETYYFKKGITYSYTGLYSPTFRMNFIGPFDVGGSSIFPKFEEEAEYLLAVLCCTFVRYIVKNFIEHTPNTQKGSIEKIPIPLVNDSIKKDIILKVRKIISLLQNDNKADSDKHILLLDKYISTQVFKITEDEYLEITKWFKRRYPHFGKSKDV